MSRRQCIYSAIYFLSRRQIDAENVAIICDIKKKHSAHSITSDVDICETAKAAEFFRADGVILTGSSTGSEANPEELENLSNALGKKSLNIMKNRFATSFEDQRFFLNC